jgi:hypothetical protein
MPDFGTMVTRLESEIHRTNINAAVRSAILDAILHYEEGPAFHFNSERSTASTIIGNKYLPLPAEPDAPEFVDFLGTFPLQITVNQSTYPLNRRGHDYLQLIDLDAVVGRGIPFDWTYEDNQIRLYPIPQDVYTLTLYYKSKLTPITADTDDNAWTTQGERLIRARAKWDVYCNQIHQFDKAAKMEEIAQKAYMSLQGIRGRRAVSGTVQGYYL